MPFLFRIILTVFLVLIFLTSQPAKAQSGLSLSGNYSYVTFGAATQELGASSFTLEAWINKTGPGAATGTGTGGITAIPVITKGRGESDTPAHSNMNYFFGINQKGNLTADFEDNINGGNHPITGTSVLSENVWYHIAATYDGTTWRLYLNGSLETELLAGSFSPENLSIQHACLGTAMNSNGTADGFFAGILDEIRIWNYARTQNEIFSNINLQLSGTLPGLLARYGLNEGAGTVVRSTAGKKVDGTIIGNSFSWIAGVPVFKYYPPGTPAIVMPANDVTIDSTSASLGVSVTDPDRGNLTVNFYGRPKIAAANPFSLIVLPDAQYYTSGGGERPAIFTAQTQWCVDNKTIRNIKYVSQVGDITDDNSISSWNNANASMSLLDATYPGIPYGIVLGNHDMVTMPSLLDTYFPASRFEGRSYYGGHYGTNNENHFGFFDSGGLEFIVINLSNGSQVPGANVISWADSLLKRYAYKRGIVVNHSVVFEGNPATFTYPGRTIYNALKNNANLFMMLGGDNEGEGIREDTYNGNTVFSLLADYQAEANGGNGWLRIIEFDPANNSIHISRYSPTLGQWKTGSDSQFDLPYNMQSNTFQLIGTNIMVPSGSKTKMIWSGLSEKSSYEWFAKVSNDFSAVTSPTWSFNTGTVSRALELGACTKTDILCNGGNTGSVAAGPVYGSIGTVHYAWKNSANEIAGTTPSLSDLPAGTYALSVTDDRKSPVTCTITINELPGNAGILSGKALLCAGEQNIAYSISSIEQATNYVWSLPAGASIASGEGSPGITVNYSKEATSGIVSVYGTTICGNSNISNLPVVVKPLVASAGNISGPASVCQNSKGLNFSVAPMANATSYTWSVPAGAKIVAGANTSSIVVDLDMNTVSGPVTVCGSNSCGNSNITSLTVEIKPLTGAAGPISGPAAICQGSKGINFRVAPIANAISYTWSLPAGAIITSGANTNSIEADLSMGTVSGQVLVYGSNGCGLGTVSPAFNLIVHPIPSIPLIGADGTTLVSSASNGNQWYFSETKAGFGTEIAGGTGKNITPLQNGWYRTQVTLLGCISDASSPLYRLKPGEENNYSIYPVPSNGVFNVNIITADQEKINIQIFSQTGQKIYEQPGIDINGVFSQEVNLRNISTGIYTVIIRDKGGKAVARKIYINR